MVSQLKSLLLSVLAMLMLLNWIVQQHLIVNGLTRHVVTLIVQQKQPLLHAMLEVVVLTIRIMFVHHSLNAQITNILMEQYV